MQRIFKMNEVNALTEEKTQKLLTLICSSGWSRIMLKRRLFNLKRLTTRIKNLYWQNDLPTNKARVWLALKTSVSTPSLKHAKSVKLSKRWSKNLSIVAKQCQITRLHKSWCSRKTRLSSLHFTNSLEINSKIRSISRSTRKESLL